MNRKGRVEKLEERGRKRRLWNYVIYADDYPGEQLAARKAELRAQAKAEGAQDDDVIHISVVVYEDQQPRFSAGREL